MSGVGVPKKRRRWIWWVVLAVVVLAVAALTLPKLFTSSAADQTYTTGTVTRTALTATVSGSGSIAVAGLTQVQPGITGTVEDLSVKLGDTVKAGQTLFTIVNDDLDAAVQRAEASYQQAKQQVQQASISVTQATNALYNAEHPSAAGTATPVVDAKAVALAKKQLTLAKMGVTSANLSLSSASTALKQARDTADKRTVTAPVDGLVTVLNATNGQSLTGSGSSSTSAAGSGSGSTGAVEISDLGTLRARIQVNEVDLVKIKLGQKANVTYDALPNDAASGTVSAIAPTGTSTQGVVTYDVDITLDKIDSRLRPNMSCTVDIVVDTKESALVVPTSALRTDSSTKKKYVLVIDAAGNARQTDVTTGLVVGTNTEVLTGLTEGDTIVTSYASSTTSSSSSSGSGGNRSGMGGIGAMMGGGRP